MYSSNTKYLGEEGESIISVETQRELQAGGNQSDENLQGNKR